MGKHMVSKENIMTFEVVYRLHEWMAQENRTLFELRDSGKITSSIFHKVVKRTVLTTGEVVQLCSLIGIELDEVQAGPKTEPKFLQFIHRLSQMEAQYGKSRAFLFKKEFSHWALRNLSLEEFARYEMWFCHETGIELSKQEFSGEQLLKFSLPPTIENERKGPVNLWTEADEEQEE